MKLARRTIIASALITLAAGCSKWNSDEAPAGFAVIREHSMGTVVFENNLPVRSTLDFSIIEVDGKPVEREKIPPLVDMQPGALVAAGNHEFKALVSPHLRPPNHRPSTVVFRASAQSKKVYYLVDRSGEPVLVEAQADKR